MAMIDKEQCGGVVWEWIGVEGLLSCFSCVSFGVIISAGNGIMVIDY